MHSRHIVMLAAENASLKRGKVGGLADVIRDLPNALADLGWRVTVIVPAYGFLHTENPSRPVATIRFPFAGSEMAGELWETTPRQSRPNVRHLLFEHPGIRGTPIYHNDPPRHAFAQDATKYALFCSAIGRYLRDQGEAFILHLHDWHMGFMPLLRELHPAFAHLRDTKTVFTIHNLAIQGTRPMRGPYASVERWFPELFRKTSWIKEWKDPRYREASFTPLAAGIRFADRVNTVSPTYAKEILAPSNHDLGIFRGEGLDPYLRKARKDGKLSGILNGCEYPPDRIAPRFTFKGLCDLILAEVRRWSKDNDDPLFSLIRQRIASLRKEKVSIIVASITRIVEQKVRLLGERGSDGRPAIDKILSAIRDAGGLYIVLGTGTRDYEAMLEKKSRKSDRLLFLKGYSDPIAEALYANGDLFMMPSLFEPCGLGQMIAMRDGQPCVVNAVGGLRDTVEDGVNGFSFSGPTMREQADRLVDVTRKALRICLEDKPRWEKIRADASRARFTWESSAKEYVKKLYS